METYDNKDVNKSDYYTYFNQQHSNAGIEVNPDYKEGVKLSQWYSSLIMKTGL